MVGAAVVTENSLGSADICGSTALYSQKDTFLFPAPLYAWHSGLSARHTANHDRFLENSSVRVRQSRLLRRGLAPAKGVREGNTCGGYVRLSSSSGNTITGRLYVCGPRRDVFVYPGSWARVSPLPPRKAAQSN